MGILDFSMYQNLLGYYATLERGSYHSCPNHRHHLLCKPMKPSELVQGISFTSRRSEETSDSRSVLGNSLSTSSSRSDPPNPRRSLNRVRPDFSPSTTRTKAERTKTRFANALFALQTPQTTYWKMSFPAAILHPFGGDLYVFRSCVSSLPLKGRA